MIRQQLEFDQYIAPDGEIYQFSNKLDKFIFPVGNLGMSPIRYITQRGPFQHGETVLDYFLEPRVIQLRHRRIAKSRTGQWETRADIIDYLRPNRQLANSLDTGVLRKILPDGSIRDISVLVQEGPTFRESLSGNQWDQWAADDVIRFIAHDPTFFDPDPVVTNFGFSSFDELQFPIDFSISFFSSVLDETSNFEYSGTWLSYPVIEITGPISGIIITNMSTEKKIELDYNISDGEVVTINTGYGNKTIVNGSGTNLIGTLTSDSDLDTFAIVPDPEADDGTNIVRVEGTDADPDKTGILFTYFTRYIGI